MIVHADGTGHVEDVALVRGREARARRGADRGDRVAHGLAGTGPGDHGHHVLPAGAHRRAVHDVAAERIAGLHDFRIIVPDESRGHGLGPCPGDLGHGVAIAHGRRVHVDPGTVRAAGDPRRDLADEQPAERSAEHHDGDDEESGQDPLAMGKAPLAREDVEQSEDVEPVARHRTDEGEHGEHRQCGGHGGDRVSGGWPDRPPEVGYPVGLEFRIDVHPHTSRRHSPSASWPTAGPAGPMDGWDGRLWAALSFLRW